jgi:hypothetical protein
MCPCHGMLSYELFKAGKGSGREGWWTNEDLVEQYNSKFLPKFLELHPNKVGLIMFDISQNHNAKAPDGLDASKFNRFDVSDKLPKTNMRDGWFVDTITGEKKQQSMHLENGNYKGLETI